MNLQGSRILPVEMALRLSATYLPAGQCHRFKNALMLEGRLLIWLLLRGAVSFLLATGIFRFIAAWTKLGHIPGLTAIRFVSA